MSRIGGVDPAAGEHSANEAAGAALPNRAGSPRAAIILGNDAVAAARPSSPAELARACKAAGFDIVVPPSWGDELVADGYLAQLSARRDGVVVACACARVRELLNGSLSATQLSCVTIAAPPLAAARYLRLVYGDELLVTYVGDCPSASDPSINARFTPAGFLASLHRQGVTLNAAPASADTDDAEVDDAELDRWRRHRSLPGGLPARRLLARPPVDRLLREVGLDSVDAATWKTSRSRVLLDLSDAAGCACGGHRAQVEDKEPPRSPTPILVEPPGLSLDPEPTKIRVESVSPPQRPDAAVASPRAHEGMAKGSPVAAPVNVERSPRRSSPPPVALTPPRPVAPRRAAPAPAPAHSPARGPAERASGRSNGMLIAIPGVVLAVTAALGIAVYLASAAGSPNGAASSHPRSTLTGETAARDSLHDSADDSLVRSTSQPDSMSASAPALPPAGVNVTPPRPRRARQTPQLVPGWLPQGEKAWTPADTLPVRRPDSLRAVPARPDTTPRA